ncbi:MAG: pyridoxal phosphate-dependent decarboxylase family protein [Ktedonobacteraceae bacterium]
MYQKDTAPLMDRTFQCSTASLAPAMAPDASEALQQYVATSSPLAMTPEEFHAAGLQTAELAAAYYAERPTQPVYTAPTGEVLARLRTSTLPAQGMSAEEILNYFAREIMPYDMGNQRPTFSPWVNPAAAPISIFMDHLASVMNPTSAKGLHAATEVEKLVIHWLEDLIGFPTVGSGGIFVNGGSLANFHGLSAALYWASKKYGWDLRENGVQGNHPQFVIYGSREVHSCVEKSVRLLGLGMQAYHRIGVDRERRIDIHELRKTIARDRAAGLWPFALVGSGGTVNTGVVDPLSALADLCAEEELWLHIDGAYGWPGFLDERIAHLYGDGLARAHSIALDGHKWLAATNTCSCTLVRDKDMLAGAFGFEASYLCLQEDEGFGMGERFDMVGMYQTRHFLAAKLFGVLLQLGRTGLREHIMRHTNLARHMMQQIKDTSDLELLAETDLTVVCFRYVPAALRGDDKRLNLLNKEIVRRLMLGGEQAFVSGTDLDGCFAIRSCALHYNLNENDVETILAVVRRVGKQIA